MLRRWKRQCIVILHTHIPFLSLSLRLPHALSLSVAHRVTAQTMHTSYVAKKLGKQSKVGHYLFFLIFVKQRTISVNKGFTLRRVSKENIRPQRRRHHTITTCSKIENKMKQKAKWMMMLIMMMTTTMKMTFKVWGRNYDWTSLNCDLPWDWTSPSVGIAPSPKKPASCWQRGGSASQSPWRRTGPNMCALSRATPGQNKNSGGFMGQASTRFCCHVMISRVTHTHERGREREDNLQILYCVTKIHKNTKKESQWTLFFYAFHHFVWGGG